MRLTQATQLVATLPLAGRACWTGETSENAERGSQARERVSLRGAQRTSIARGGGSPICAEQAAKLLVSTDLAGPRGRGAKRAPAASHSRQPTGAPPEYMAPEQLLSDPIDARADIYSFGVVLFRWLTGELPFTSRATLGLFAHHVGSKAPPNRGNLSALEPGPSSFSLLTSGSNFSLQSSVFSLLPSVFWLELNLNLNLAMNLGLGVIIVYTL